MDAPRGRTRSPTQPPPSLARAVSSPPMNRRPPEAQQAVDAGPTPSLVPTSQPTQEAPLDRHEARGRVLPSREQPISHSQAHEPFETQQPYNSETSVGDGRKFWKRPMTPTRAEVREASDSSDTDDDDVFLSSPSRPRRPLHNPPLANFLKSPQGIFETPRSKRRKKNARGKRRSNEAPHPAASSLRKLRHRASPSHDGADRCQPSR